MNTETAHRILNSQYRAHTSVPGGGTISDALNFGFSFVESQDHFVEYIVANAGMMQQILKEVSDAKLDPDDDKLGKLWTADLVVSRKVRDGHLVFSNGGHTAVLFLNTNPDKNGA
jgi:hypothetical protein